ncbi:RecA/RadA recombinase [Microbacterium resistens]|uniref:RecA/RadA recombinase n=1 Tax=Microbacterium resistens TaxID=156977 RepID=A0ABU1S9K3_9MICO|nr:AAA domain-containing protein [Microbacterium resistens]MDR6866290.1 RecA/RadA recombinase [Microbacterium resistens]
MSHRDKDPVQAARERAFGLGWKGIHELASEAIEGDVQHALLHGSAVELPSMPCGWNSDARRIEIVVGSRQGVLWKQTKFFAVDADLDPKRVENRQPLEYERYFPSKGLLTLSIPPQSRARLAQAVKVRVFRSDDTELKIKEGLQSALGQSSRGDVLASLWSRVGAGPSHVAKNPDYLPPDRAMNEGQLRALSAMTSPGGFLVWGPPGTGKTTVITSAVVDALRADRSVLIASHTNVAVDNVLRGIIEDDVKYGLGLTEPGRLVRHAGDDQKVLPAIAEHRYLLVEKAAALITNVEQRRAVIDGAIGENRSHQDRVLELRIRRELDAAEIAVTILIRAVDAEAELTALSRLRDDISLVVEEQQKAEEEHRRVYRAYAEFAGSGDRLRAHEEILARVTHGHAEHKVALDHLHDEVRARERMLKIASSNLRTAEISLRSGWRGVFPWIRRRHELLHEEAFRGEQAAMLNVEDARARRDEAVRRLREAAVRVDHMNDERDALLISARAEVVAARTAHDAADIVRAVTERRREIATRISELEEEVGDIDVHSSLINAAVQDGSMKRVIEYRNLLERVAELDATLEDLESARTVLEDEYRKTKEELLAKAPVVACTLTALTFNPTLLARRFDVVIIDEAAGASAASVVYAGSRADRTLAVVGDFLQNAPINEIEDPRTEEESRIAAWRTSDVFELVGIADRKSADEHPRCIALSTQYRYPPIIASVVNRFCYDGLLDSARSDPEDGVAVMTFIDTSRVTGLRFKKAGESWSCEATANIAIDYAALSTGSTGFVTPYVGQAKLVASKAAARGLVLPAGTAHRFQGQEYETVIFDLMQDDKPRWIAGADLRAGRRANSAAKLLNVALTRAKDRIFLIGNWEFVRSQSSPGMQAIAMLEGHPLFRIERA